MLRKRIIYVSVLVASLFAASIILPIAIIIPRHSVAARTIGSELTSTTATTSEGHANNTVSRDSISSSTTTLTSPTTPSSATTEIGTSANLASVSTRLALMRDTSTLKGNLLTAFTETKTGIPVMTSVISSTNRPISVVTSLDGKSNNTVSRDSSSSTTTSASAIREIEASTNFTSMSTRLTPTRDTSTAPSTESSARAPHNRSEFLTTAITEIMSTESTSIATIETSTSSGATTASIPINYLPLSCSSTNVFGVFSTFAGGNSLALREGYGLGNYPPGEEPWKSCDQNVSTKFLNFGSCFTPTNTSLTCGLNSGLYITPSQNTSQVIGLQTCSGNDFPTRDPMMVTLEGSTQRGANLTRGSSWRLIYRGSTGLDLDPGRSACGQPMLFNNSLWFASYRLLFTSKRGPENSIQFSEFRLIIN